MSINSEVRFDLSFKDLIVWAKPPNKSKWCISKTKSMWNGLFKPKNLKSDTEKPSTLKNKTTNEKNNFDTQNKPDQLKNSTSQIATNIDKIMITKNPSSHKLSLKKTGDIAILKNIQGNIRSDEMVAILGPSGSGKTTFLNFISSRSNWGQNLFVDGKLFLNNKRVKYLSKYKHLIGFVSQDDTISEHVSVIDNILTHGILRGIPDFRKKARKVIKDLGLVKCKNNKIGETGNRGVSGGERKRTCIGVELMSNPKILFLDEPTTGIDAHNALEVMKILKKLNEKKGIGVVTVIHQPRQEIVDLFDKVSHYF